MHASASGPVEARLRRTSGLAAVCFSLYVSLVFALHFLPTGYDPAVNFVSEYAIGPFGWALTIALVALAGGGAGLLSAMQASGPAPLRSVAGGLVAVWIVMTVLLAIFPVDPIQVAFAESGSPHFSRAGWIHALAGMIGSVALMTSMALVSVRLAPTLGLDGYRRILLALTATAILGYGAMLATRPGTFPAGLYQRVYLASSTAWLLIVALELRTGRPGAGSDR